MAISDTEAARSPLPRGYEFVRVLGSGGFGWVALARQSAVGRYVAIKTLYAGRADQTERRRLEREGQALARLRDPRIVSVYALETVGEDLALILEFVDGADLRDVLDKNPLSGSALLRVLTEVAGALDAANAAGVVHRDVKPANVLVGRDGPAKLTDFGIARISAAASAFRTAGASIIGTPRYMAPELILDPTQESPAADAYSFAAMVYEVLAGRTPFMETEAMQLLYAHTSTPPPSPRLFVPHLSPSAEAVLLAGLAKEPSARPTPGQLMSVLASYPSDWAHLVGAPSLTRPAAAAAAALPAAAPVAPTAGEDAPSIRFDTAINDYIQPPIYVAPPAAAAPRKKGLFRR
jgi:serine/threonine-protein kinase